MDDGFIFLRYIRYDKVLLIFWINIDDYFRFVYVGIVSNNSDN